jgi:hypothetical protein
MYLPVEHYLLQPSSVEGLIVVETHNIHRGSSHYHRYVASREIVVWLTL